jgi:Kef-type K+ transport system membrane component KefB
MHITVLLGAVLLIGLVFGRLFSWMGIPQVVGFIIVGVILGGSVTNVFSRDMVDALTPVTSLALALIGFMVGGELKHSVFGKYGKQFLTILLSEGLLAMAFVGVATFLWTGNLALAALLGALSSATAPAATVDVLWEYRSRGPLTQTILAIVALDDGLALFLYGFALAFADVMLSSMPFSPELMLVKPAREIGGALLLGAIGGFLLDLALQRMTRRDERLTVTLGGILLATGIAAHFGLSLILANMVIGLYLTNVHAHRNESIFEVIRGFSPPLLILFFVMIGARLQLGLILQMGMLGVLYVVARTAGKWSGSYLGARWSGAPDTVRRYLGFALFSQAGVAIGLALDVYGHFAAFDPAGARLGQTIINVVTATTFVVQIIGPPSVKYAIRKAGEITHPDSVSEG